MERFARFKDGFFVFAADRHLCHITLASKQEFVIFSPYHNPPWLAFDQSQGLGINWPSPIILKAKKMDEYDCDSLGFYVKQIYKSIGVPCPPKYAELNTMTIDELATLSRSQ